MAPAGVTVAELPVVSDACPPVVSTMTGEVEPAAGSEDAEFPAAPLHPLANAATQATEVTAALSLRVRGLVGMQPILA